MMASIDLTTSGLINLVCANACSARVRTACWTASLASSVFGLNSLRRSASSSVASTAPVADSVISCDLVSAMTVLRSVVQRLRRARVLSLLGRCQRLQERRVLQQLADKLLGP